jgi:hypothetical protein
VISEADLKSVGTSFRSPLSREMAADLPASFFAEADSGSRVTARMEKSEEPFESARRESTTAPPCLPRRGQMWSERILIRDFTCGSRDKKDLGHLASMVKWEAIIFSDYTKRRGR